MRQHHWSNEWQGDSNVMANWCVPRPNYGDNTWDLASEFAGASLVRERDIHDEIPAMQVGVTGSD